MNKLPMNLLALIALSAAANWGLAPLAAQTDNKTTAARPTLIKPVIPEEITGTLRSINEMLSRDVTPEENAAVSLVQIFGEDVFEPELRQASLAMLGIERLADGLPKFVFMDEFVSTRSSAPPEGHQFAAALLGQQIALAGGKPWTPDEFPAAYEFLSVNQHCLDQILTASRQPRFYAPMLSVMQPPRLLSASLVIERRLPFIAHVLAARAMLKFQQQEFLSALEDLFACQRLAVLLAVGSPFDVSAAKAQTIDSIANRSVVVMIESGRLPADQAMRYLVNQAAVPPFPSAALSADTGERAILHQEIEFLKIEDESVRDFLEIEAEDSADSPLPELRLADIRFDEALRRADEIQDEIVKALAIVPHQEQDRLFDQLDQQFEKWVLEADHTSLKLLKPEVDTIALSRWVGEAMSMSLRPWYRQRRRSNDRAETRRNLVIIGMALTAFHEKHSAYPAELAELSPRFLDVVPLDPFSESPFQYHRLSDQEVEVASWGANRQDDAGQHFSDDHLLHLGRKEEPAPAETPKPERLDCGKPGQ